MAESSLSIGFPDLQSEVGRLLGYGSVVANFSAGQLVVVNKRVQSGVRRVYYPSALSVEMAGYEWSWLKPTTTIDIESEEADYDLPDDFGRLIGCLHYPSEEYRQSISIVSVGKILSLRANSSLTGAPVFAATRYKASTGANGQRQEILFFPEPDDDWTLSYEYEAYSGALSDTYPYPLGGMQLAELYIESCLAIVEERDFDEVGVHTERYKALLVDAIARDRKRGTRNFGNMGNVERDGGVPFRRGWGSSTYSITYNGEAI